MLFSSLRRRSPHLSRSLLSSLSSMFSFVLLTNVSAPAFTVVRSLAMRQSCVAVTVQWPGPLLLSVGLGQWSCLVDYSQEYLPNVSVQCFELINSAQWPKCGHNWKHTLFSLNPAQHVILWSAAVNRDSKMEEGGSPWAKKSVVGLYSYCAGKLHC